MMKIEIIDNKQFAYILIDGEKWKEIHKRLYKRYLKEILCIYQKKDLIDLCLKIDTKIARTLVYKWLAIRSFMKSEIVRKLKSYKIDPQAMDTVLRECEKLGYLDDVREGKLFIERKKRKGEGPASIAAKLSRKAPELREMAHHHFTEDEQQELIAYWVKKKTVSQDLTKIQVKQRLYRFLIGKGFDHFLVRKHLLLDE